ncbi:MAG TPA: hypothetical protein VL101_01790, partial [Nordella sp.]|nr:hypothetical protein [Nordella sp.]
LEQPCRARVHAPLSQRKYTLAMVSNIYKFRRVKWGDPKEKLKVLSEDFRRKLWLDRLSTTQFLLLVAVVSGMTFACVGALGFYSLL